MTSVLYREPATIEEACALLDEYGDDARVMAGGTALVLFMRQQLLSPGVLINLQRVAGLNQIGVDGGLIGLGATVTHASAARATALHRQYPALADTFAKVATPRIRNAGTVGGNLAHGDPHLDPPVTLLALDGLVSAQSSRGTRTLKLTDFFVDYYETALRPDEILTEVAVPVRVSRSGLAFLKFLPRSQDDYAVVDVAVWTQLAEDGETIGDVRIALGSVGPVVFRASAAEALLRGQRPSDALLGEVGAAAAAAADPEDDVRGSAAYKRELVGVLVGRTVKRAVADAIATAALPQPVVAG